MRPPRTGTRGSRFGVGIAALLLGSLCASARAESVLFREDFERGLGERWVERGFPSIARRNRFFIAKDDIGNRYLRAESDDSYSAKGVFLAFSPRRCPALSWRWRIDGVIATADIHRREGDDAPAKIYVVFEGPSLWNPFDKRVLLYVWDNAAPAGAIVPNAWEPERERMIVLQSGNARAGEWVEEQVDLRDDFERAFPGEEPLDVEGIAFVADTDNTHSRASAGVDDLVVRCGGEVSGNRAARVTSDFSINHRRVFDRRNNRSTPRIQASGGFAMGNNPLRVTNDASFSSVVERPGPVLALFGSRGNACCEVMELGLATLARELEGSVEFVRCPLHEGFGTFRRYRVRRVPTLILFRGGVPLAAYDGLATIPRVRAWIDSTLETRWAATA